MIEPILHASGKPDSVLACQFCSRTNVPGSLTESYASGTVHADGTVEASGPLTDANFVCDACMAEIERDEVIAELADCEGSA